MPKFRKKPVEVKAYQLTIHNAIELAQWCGGRVRGEFVDIPTLEGVMTANVGDFIIRGVQGEFYPCKPDIFWETYEDAS